MKTVEIYPKSTNYGDYPTNLQKAILKQNADGKVIILNWIENRVERNMIIGFLFFFYCFFCKVVLKKHIVWIIHNHYPHNRINTWRTSLTRKLFTLIGTKFMSHGLNYSNMSSIHYIHHPCDATYHKHTSKVNARKLKLLVLGRVSPYKDYLELHQFLKKNIKKNSEIIVTLYGGVTDNRQKNVLNGLNEQNILYKVKGEFDAISDLKTMEFDAVIVPPDNGSTIVSASIYDALTLQLPAVIVSDAMYQEVKHMPHVTQSLNLTNYEFCPERYHEEFTKQLKNTINA